VSEPRLADGGRSRRVFFASWAAFALIGALWALATPISAAPDEPAHLIKAASVVRGQLVGAPGEFGHEVQVPRAVARTHELTCFAFHPEQSAACAKSTPGDAAELVDASTTAGLYNPLYYLLVGWPSLIVPGDAGIYAMRLCNAVLVGGLLAASFALIAGWQRRVLPFLGLLAASTPMLFFLLGVVNPSGPEIAGTLTATVAAFTIVLRQAPERVASHSAIMAAGAVIAANMRGISPLWVAVALAAPLVLIGWGASVTLLRRRAVAIASATIVLGSLAAAAWTAFSNSLGYAISDDGPRVEYPGMGTSPVTAFVDMISKTFDYAHGIVAEFGWLDTSASSIVYVFWSGLVFALLLACAAVLRRRSTLVLLILLAAAVVLPALVQAAYITDGGYIWQGRYTMPVFAILVFGCAALLDAAAGDAVESHWPMTRRALMVVLAIWTYAQVDAFIRALRRYAAGWPSGWGEFLRSPEWAPPGGTILVSLAAVAVLAGAAAAAYGFATPRRAPAVVSPR
jgi:hypothetical protein